MNLEDLAAELRQFTDERDWGQFHRPKNLAMAVAGEAGELVAELRWYTDDEVETQVLQVPQKRERLEHEVADVLLFLVRLSDVCDIDLLAAARRKLALNRDRYPVDKAYGSSLTHTELARQASEGTSE